MNRPGFVLLPVLLIASACNQTPKQTATDKTAGESNSVVSTPVVVTQVSALQQLTRSDQTALSGSVESDATTNIGFNLPGRVTQVYVTEGQLIRQGQVLAKQDATSYQFNVQATNATLAQAQDAFNRATIMNERGSLAPIDFQKAISTLEQAKAAQGQAQKTVRDAVLTAPVSGVLAKVNVETGEQASPAAAQFSIVKLNPIKVVQNIPEAEINHYAKGQSARVEIPALGSSFTGRITQIGISADPATRAFRMEVSVPNPGNRIRPGMIADVNFRAKTNTKKASLTLPAELIFHEPDNTAFVYVADPQKKVASKRQVQVGALANNQVEIRSGLTTQELIVTAGQQKLHDGSAVTFTLAQE